MLICTKQKRNTLINDKLCVHINGSYIDNVTEQNVLGLIIDKSLKFDSHVNYICKKLSKLFYLFSKIRYLLTYDAKEAFYNSYILPCFHYGVTTWGYSSKENLTKLYQYQKRIGRLILNDFESSGEVLLSRLGWLSVYKRVDFNTAKLMYKCFNDSVPDSLRSLFTVRNNRSLRNSGIDLSLPLPKCEFRKKCFDYYGCILWNSISQYIRRANDIMHFKKLLKEYLLLN